MKNLIHLKNIEELPIDTLSLLIRGKHSFTTKPHNNWMKYNRRRDYHGKVGNISLRKFVGNLLEKSIGKPFDDVFSYFCIKAPKFSQKIFLEEFEPYKINDENYIIDENGLIQENPLYPKWRKSRNLTYKSDDFKEEFRHKVRGTVAKPDYIAQSNRWCRHKGCDHHNCSDTLDDYEWVTVEGWSKTFDRWNDPEFKSLRIKQYWRLKNKYRDTYRPKSADFHVLIENFKDKREANIKWTEQQEQWRLWREERMLEKARKEQEETLIKLIAHGFDPIKSFRGFKIR